MHHFAYRRGASNASAPRRGGRPRRTCRSGRHALLLLFDRDARTPLRVFADAFAGMQGTLVCYSVKANSNLGVLATLARHGAGMDVVSEGELRRALAVGVAPEKIVFSGVGKTRAEMAFALEAGIFAFNVELEPELRALSEVAAARGTTARIAFRVNPDVDAKTHHKIATGKAENKFGVPFAEAPALYELAQRAARHRAARRAHAYRQPDHRARSVPQCLRPAERACATLRADGFAIDFVNLGGGLGVPYRSDAAAPPLAGRLCASSCSEAVGDLGVRLLFEPGRMIAGNAGILVSRVLYVKHGASKTFTIVDAAMNDLIRPTLYEAYHEICPVAEPAPGTPIDHDRRGRARSARPAIISRLPAPCPSFTPAISFP